MWIDDDRPQQEKPGAKEAAELFDLILRLPGETGAASVVNRWKSSRLESIELLQFIGNLNFTPTETRKAGIRHSQADVMLRQGMCHVSIMYVPYRRGDLGRPHSFTAESIYFDEAAILCALQMLREITADA